MSENDYSPFTVVVPVSIFGRDLSWLSQDMLHRLARAKWRGDKYFVKVRTQICKDDVARMEEINEVVDQDDFNELMKEIREDMNIPDPEGDKQEWNIWLMQRRINEGTMSDEDNVKTWKIMGEYKGWLAKPSERGATVVTVNNGTLPGMPTTVNANDSERVYRSMLTGRN